MRLNKENHYYGDNRTKLARRKGIGVMRCILTCLTCTVGELEFKKESLADGTAAGHHRVLLPTWPARPDLEISPCIGCGLPSHIYKPNPPFTAYLLARTRIRKQHIFKTRFSSLRAATAAPSSWHHEEPQPGSLQRVKPERRWQDLANLPWLPIKLMLFIKNVFSITHISSHPDMNIPEISQGQLCTWMSLSHISKPLRWQLLFLSLGEEQSCPLKAPAGSHFPITVISR